MQAIDDGGVARRGEVLENCRTVGGRHEVGLDLVFYRDGDAVQRTHQPGRLELRVELCSMGQRIGIDALNRIQLWPGLIIGGDAVEISLYQSCAGQLSRAQCSMRAVDGRLDEMERRGRLGRRRLRKRRQRQQREQRCRGEEDVGQAIQAEPRCGWP